MELKTARKAKGLSRRAFSEKVKISIYALDSYESGIRKPPPDVAERIAEALDWTLETMWASLYRNSSYHKFNG